MSIARYLALLVLAVLLVACNSGASATATPDVNDNPPAATASDGDETPAATATPDDDDKGEGVGAGDLADMRDQLAPPNSTRVSNTEVPNGLAASYNSTSSVEELSSYYENRFGELSLTVVSTSEISGGISWLLSDGDLNNFGGTVSLFPFEETTQVSIGLGAAAD